MAKAVTSETPRAQAEAKLRDLEAHGVKMRADIEECERVLSEQKAAADVAATRREDAAALDDAKAAAEALEQVREAVARQNAAGTKLRGLHRLAQEIESQIPSAAVAAAEMLLAELDADTKAARARLDGQGFDERDVERYALAWLESYGISLELMRVTGENRYNRGWELRAELERLNLGPLVPGWIAFRNVPKPRPAEAWRPQLGPALEAYKAQREDAAKAARIAADTRRVADRPAGDDMFATKAASA